MNPKSYTVLSQDLIPNFLFHRLRCRFTWCPSAHQLTHLALRSPIVSANKMFIQLLAIPSFIHASHCVSMWMPLVFLWGRNKAGEKMTKQEKESVGRKSSWLTLRLFWWTSTWMCKSYVVSVFAAFIQLPPLHSSCPIASNCSSVFHPLSCFCHSLIAFLFLYAGRFRPDEPNAEKSWHTHTHTHHRFVSHAAAHAGEIAAVKICAL